MVPLSWLPAINACLNAASALLLAAGFVAIRRGRETLHHRLILTALATGLSLTSYLYYHAYTGTTRFAGVGWIRPVYFAIPGSHTVLAAAILPLVGVTLARALPIAIIRRTIRNSSDARLPGRDRF